MSGPRNDDVDISISWEDIRSEAAAPLPPPTPLAPAPDIRWLRSGDAVQGRCAVCPIDLVAVRDGGLRCTGCSVTYHPDCFALVGSCSTPGCLGRVESEADEGGTNEIGTALAGARIARALLLAGAVTACLLFMSPLALAIGTIITPTAGAVVGGLAYGALLGAILGSDEGITSRSWRVALQGMGIGGLVGVLAGALGASVGQTVYTGSGGAGGIALGWTVFGMALGSSQGLARRSVRGALVGLIGGLLAGVVAGAIAGAAFQHSSGTLVRTSAAILPFPFLIALSLATITELTNDVWLSVESGKMRGKRFLLDRPVTSIGSAPWAAHIAVLDDPAVAPEHVRIVRRRGHVEIDSLPARMVWVNGRLVSRSAIRDGDTLRVGSTMFRLARRKAER